MYISVFDLACEVFLSSLGFIYVLPARRISVRLELCFDAHSDFTLSNSSEGRSKSPSKGLPALMEPVVENYK